MMLQRPKQIEPILQSQNHVKIAINDVLVETHHINGLSKACWPPFPFLETAH